MDVLATLRTALAPTYRLERELGRGGMATVFLAQDVKHDRSVALKVLDAELAASLGAERFLREIRIAARLQHPHIVPLYDSGQVYPERSEGPPVLYYVMPFIEGESLRERLRRDGRLAPKQAIGWAREVADALGYAHGQGIVHRDIKPENVLISGSHALVADFGIARAISQAGKENLTQGLAIGTPAYMSPEQAAGDPDVDARSDVYSLACLVYEMLAGVPPFTGPTVQALIAAHIVQTAPSLPGDISNGLPAAAEALAKALLKKPADRFQTAAEFADALTAAEVTTLRVLQNPKATRQVTPTTAENSIAVLPFANLSADKENEYFSDGMTEELIHALSRLKGLRVASRTSAFAFKGKNEDIRNIGERLNVRTVLEGSIRRSGDQLRLTAQLINVADGYHIWSETYQRKVEDVFAIQDDISRAIVEALKIRLGAGADRALVKRYTEDVEAYKLYLQGRYWWNKRTSEGMTRAIRFFQDAITRDPNYALAYAGLADSYALVGVGYGNMEPGEAFSRARAAALKALEIDENLAEAHASLAFVAYRHEWDWDAAEQGFRKALELDPNSIQTRHWYALYLAMRRRFTDALQQLDKALELDPLSLIIMTGRGRIFQFLNQPEKALECFQRTLELDPNFPQAHFDMGLTFLLLKRHDESIAALKRAVELSGGRSLWLAMLAWAYGSAGRRPEAEAIRDQVLELARTKHVSSYELALLHAGLGEMETAVDHLEKAYDEHSSLLLYLGVDPLVWGLAEYPRAKALLRKLKLE